MAELLIWLSCCFIFLVGALGALARHNILAFVFFSMFTIVMAIIGATDVHKVFTKWRERKESRNVG